MRGTTACTRPASRSRHIGYVAILAALALFPRPGALSAETGLSDWLELVRACETVISDQTFAPLQDYAPAPFAAGLPGVKEYSVYNEGRTLVAIARVTRGAWDLCLVRESTEDRSHWREMATDWEKGFKAAFPTPGYHWLHWRFPPERLSPGALRCRGESLPILVAPILDGDFHFRVEVTSFESPAAAKWCGDEAGTR